MNPDRIYSQYRDDALATQATATEYSTFVAMPFANRFSYHSQQIYKEVIQAAAERANELNQSRKKFAVPKRVDDGAATAVVITEAIVTDILYSHLFIADLTFENPGVVLETGIAMGLKSNRQIILITQGNVHELHFDIRNNNVFSYNPVNAVAKIADAMIGAAKSFETESEKRIDSIKRVLTSDAVHLLHAYGIFQKEEPKQSLYRQLSERIFGDKNRSDDRFEASARELLENRLLYTDYKPNAAPGGGDRFGMHATYLGWVVIGRMWPELARQLK
jgi:hypothetical protein